MSQLDRQPQRRNPAKFDPTHFRIIPIAVGILLVSLLLVLIIIGAVAVVRRKISGARNSPSSQLELLNNQKLETGLELDYSPDLIPKDQGRLHNITTLCLCLFMHNIEIEMEPEISEILYCFCLIYYFQNHIGCNMNALNHLLNIFLRSGCCNVSIKLLLSLVLLSN